MQLHTAVLPEEHSKVPLWKRAFARSNKGGIRMQTLVSSHPSPHDAPLARPGTSAAVSEDADTQNPELPVRWVRLTWYAVCAIIVCFSAMLWFFGSQTSH